ncbi:MAG: endonuclease Q family protein [Candidatus Omnitrophica bacterium]|nr:endonuclease Q family protein [Candidatus Omnitrophota bacterium]
MRFYADLHLHSHYSRATSKNLNLEYLALWAQLKGIQVVGTGDFTHPSWMKELKEKLEPAEEGLFRLKDQYAKATERELPAACKGEVRFLLTVEISNIYKRLDKVRKVHNLVFAPHFAAAEKTQKELGDIGNISSDGRPILGLDSRDLLEIVLESDPMGFLIPAHIWTPWFSALGSKGGFDRMEDCFGDLTKHVFAVETGLSSDPLMNWRLSQLDPYVLVSFGDAHSPPKLAREATIFDTELSYPAIYRALSDRKDKGLIGTVEFFPEEGKYHYDGHRLCKTRLHPKETIKNNGLCPVCGKSVVVGVMARVEELADHPEGRKSPNWRPYQNLIPLPEIIAEAKGMGVNSGAVQMAFTEILNKLGNELFILQEASIQDIKRAAGSLVAEAIQRSREGKVNIEPGYDGEYGHITIFSSEERESSEDQMVLF